MTRIQNNITRITNKCYFNSYKIIFLHVNSHSHTEEVNVQYVSAWDIVTLFIWFWSEVLFAIFHFSWIALSSPPTGMGSGGSAGKEAGPLKALLRQQTQSALEQRVRQRQYIHMYLYIHDHKSWWLWELCFSNLSLSHLDSRGFHHPLKHLLGQGYVWKKACRMFLVVESFVYLVSHSPPCLRTLYWKTCISSTVLLTSLSNQWHISIVTIGLGVMWLCTHLHGECSRTSDRC